MDISFQKEFCERQGSTLKSKFDESDFLFLYNNSVTNKTDRSDFFDDFEISLQSFDPPTAVHMSYRGKFWTGIRVSWANHNPF